MNYRVQRNHHYDFAGQSYATVYPNLHKYPATMLPRIGIDILKELGINKGKLLDPYCGSGSSFIAGLDQGLTEMYGFDMNPLAVLIARTKFTKVDVAQVIGYRQKLRNRIYDYVKSEKRLQQLPIPDVYNIRFWFSEHVLRHLAVIKHFLDKIKNKAIRRFFLLPFSAVVRASSFTRNHEFKLYKMKEEDIIDFNLDVFGLFFDKLNKAIDVYANYYCLLLKEAKIRIDYDVFQGKKSYYDAVLTRPPYGDSRTTVAYGQFSMLSNAWLGIDYARKVDRMLMGGKRTKQLYQRGVISDAIQQIAQKSHARSLEVSSFYQDLEGSIHQVADSVKEGGKAIYIVGNRRVKDTQLPTDQFIAEKFEEKGFRHLVTYERALGNKSIPFKNAPTNKKGCRLSTMTKEYIVVCGK